MVGIGLRVIRGAEAGRVPDVEGANVESAGGSVGVGAAGRDHTRLICEAAADAIVDGETPDHPAEETSSALPFDVLGLSVASGAGVKANERLFDASVTRRL
ncbi:hypothetical protein C8F04DRAFT_1198740 [Mycena alexandri]|uniref:Uncharacterized protein n=1 Tax=Mycena alexandri TaxID=1745969 RepID=A0AAD6S167_9AGAR|nr:hypothetical protein C8F04DRAFT_1198740 [Mycena alexandri]